MVSLPVMNSYFHSSAPTTSEKAFVPVVNLVDPLVIIAIFALPLLGLLGLGAFLFPLLPIGIYLLITYLPGTGVGRKKRSSSSSSSSKSNEKLIDDIFKRFVKTFQNKLLD